VVPDPLLIKELGGGISLAFDFFHVSKKRFFAF
jgi:hypothetical protein